MTDPETEANLRAERIMRRMPVGAAIKARMLALDVGSHYEATIGQYLVRLWRAGWLRCGSLAKGEFTIARAFP